MKTKKKMITIQSIYLLSAIISLQFNNLSASGFPEVSTINTKMEMFDLSQLAPVIPKEADFNDEAPAMELNIKFLTPETPREATFEDEPINSEISQDSLKKLAPVVPFNAEFEEYA